jgi:hypothetical protein
MYCCTFEDAKNKATNINTIKNISTMRKFALIPILLICLATNTLAKEGMWLPFLLETLNEKDMKSMGLKITAADLYNENKSSLKDAVVLFGSGCTGEMISSQGLLLTNHHCGYGTVGNLVSLEKDYYKNGFWAMNMQQEIPCKGLSVTFIEKIEDVTNTLLAGLSTNTKDTGRINEIGRRSAALIKAKSINGLGAIVKSFFNDNKYYLFVTKKYTDVRLVGFPPNSIGKFGGDTDNWAWPRHTGDFSLFRVYANNKNEPAEYSKDNKPFVPKKHFKINISGVKEGDFTMVYGFPGRTQQNLSSQGVKEVMEILDPARINIRGERLKLMEEDMRKDRAVFLQYASKQSSIANYYKKWMGELAGLKINKAIDKKLQYEQAFSIWNGGLGEYTQSLKNINSLYDNEKESALLNVYMDEAFGACEGLQNGDKLNQILDNLETKKSVDSIQKYKAMFDGFFKNYNFSTDKKISIKMMELIKEKFPTLAVNDMENISVIMDESILCHKDKLMELLANKDINTIKNIIETDRGYKLYNQLLNIQVNNFETYRQNQMKLVSAYSNFVKGKLEYANSLGKPMYPDANSTLRVSYGKVEGLTPKDGMTYNYFTTLDGVMQKEDNSVEEFEVPEKLKDLYYTKNYGKYALANGQMPLAFLASNHTTGGNSGSPVLNAYGELIGTNFDRIWEGTMSDILFDPNLCRNITLDIRYTLFIIDKFGGATWLVNEMDIVDKKVALTSKNKKAKTITQ